MSGIEKLNSIHAQLGDLALTDPDLGIDPKMARAAAAVAVDEHFELNAFGVARPRSGELLKEWAARMRESGEIPWLFADYKPSHGNGKLTLDELKKLTPMQKLAKANGEM